VPATSTVINKVSVYLKKIGSPPNLTVRINRDDNGSPGSANNDVLASGTLAANAITSSYGWVDVAFSTAPNVTAGTRYWLVLDAGNDSSNYWFWGSDAPGGYSSGQGKYSENWSNKPWYSAGRDFDFKIWMGGVATRIQDVSVGGSVHANTMQNVTAAAGAYGQVLSGGTYSGVVKVYSMSSCTVNGDAWYTPPLRAGRQPPRRYRFRYRKRISISGKPMPQPAEPACSRSVTPTAIIIRPQVQPSISVPKR